MSSQKPARSRPETDTFTAIFKAALDQYQAVTGTHLDHHPLAALLDTCDSPEAVSHILRMQAQAFNAFRRGDEKLMAWLGPTVHILSSLSATLEEGIGLVSHLETFIRNDCFQHLVCRYYRLPKQSLPASAFFSRYLSSQLPSCAYQ